MGLFDRFKKKPVVEKTLALDQVIPWYREVFGDAIPQGEAKARDLQTVLMEHFRSVPLNSLKQATFEEKDRRFAAVNMTKMTYVRRIETALQNLPIPGNDLAGYRAFRTAAHQILETLVKSNRKESVSLSQFFPKETAALINHFKIIRNSLTALDACLDSEAMGVFSGIEEKVHAIFALEKEQQENQDQFSQLKNNAERLTTRITEAEGELAAFLARDEWNQRAALEQERADKERLHATHRATIRESLGLLQRPTKKLFHATGDKTVARVLDDAETWYLEGGDAAALLGQLETMELKESEKQKVVQARELLPSLETTRTAIQKLEKELATPLPPHPLLRERQQREETIGDLMKEQHLTESQFGQFIETSRSLTDKIQRATLALESYIKEKNGDLITVKR